jgi:hypothetical protein
MHNNKDEVEKAGTFLPDTGKYYALTLTCGKSKCKQFKRSNRYKVTAVCKPCA